MADTKITKLKNLMSPIMNYFALKKALNSMTLTNDQIIKTADVMYKESEKIQKLLPEIKKILSEIPDDACEK